LASKSGSVLKHAGNNYYCALKKGYSVNRYLTKPFVVIISFDCSLFSLLCYIQHNIKNEHSPHARMEILTVILLKIQVLWVVLSWWVLN